jgi:hypothetical protein
LKGAAPAWLAEFQASFGDVIRTPLDGASGTLTAKPSAYDPRVVRDARDASNATGSDRLAVYNRQYWFRLFDLLQRAFPLTSRLTGYWLFNLCASRFLLANPPRGWEIDRVPDGFDAFFEETLEWQDAGARQAWIESARIDAAWRDVFRAPKMPSLRPSQADASRLLDSRLTPSPAVRVIGESFPLLELRRKTLGDPSAIRVAVPTALAHPRAWALVRNDEGILQIALESREAELFALLGEFSVRDALARLEHACSAEERVLLPANARAWLARGLEREFWIGFER